jgi:hypothetical protein
MVPEEFTNFFLGTVGVSGALIGLLFVAISVAPERTTQLAKVQFDLRAAKAFSLFTNTLVISLIALIPTTDIGTTAIIVGSVSVASCLAMALVALREGPAGSRTTEIARIVVQGAVFAYEIVVGIQITGTKGDQNDVESLAILVVVMFLIGIARSWQLLGARDMSLVNMVVSSFRPAGGPAGPPAPPHADPE